jgi:type IV secretion system protein VirD4
MSGSVSQSKNDPSRSLQMIERPLMTADELKALPKGTFVVTKTGFNPIQVKLKLFFKWGIQFEDKPYVVPLRDNKDICYASKDNLMRAVYDKYTIDKKNPDDEIPKGSYSVEEVLGEKNYPESARSSRAAHRAPIQTAIQNTAEETT